MKIIVGLGNPGKEYATTLHNMGFMTIDKLANKYSIDVIDLKHKGLVGKGVIGGEKVLLVKPQTFMNNSGECVREIVDFYKINLDDLIIIYDDIDLDPGQLRIRKTGSAGSHNGMKSIINHLGSTSFPRIRVGIGEKPENWDLADYVLSHITKESDKDISEGIEKAANSVEVILKDGLSEAMNIFNEKKSVN